MAEAPAETVNVVDSDEESWSDQEVPCKCLFTDKAFANAKLCLQEAKAVYGFNFYEICKQFNLDFYGKIKLLNFVRAKVKQGVQSEEILESLKHTADWEDKMYLQPVLSNDPLLFQIPDNEEEPEQTLEEENKHLKDVVQLLLEDNKKMKQDYVELLNSIDLDGGENTNPSASASIGGATKSKSAGTYFDQIDQLTEKIVPNINRYWDRNNKRMKTPAQLIFDYVDTKGDYRYESGRLFLNWVEDHKENFAMQPFMTQFSEYMYEQEKVDSKGALQDWEEEKKKTSWDNVRMSGRRFG